LKLQISVGMTSPARAGRPIERSRSGGLMNPSVEQHSCSPLPNQNSPLPNKIDAFVDAGIQTVVDGTTKRGGFEKLPLRMIRRQGHSHLRLQPHNPPRRICAHLLHRFHRHSLQLDAMPLGHDPHDRGHTGGDGRGHQIGRREAFSLAFVVNWSVGGKLGAGRAVDRFAMKLAFVSNGDLYRQGEISCGCRPASGPKPQPLPGGT